MSSDVFARQIKLRSQISPGCATTSALKYADIFADGNLAVMGSFNCRGAFIFNISNPDAPVLASWYNPGANQQFLEAIVIGNRGYFGSGNSGGVHIVDLTVPTNPQLLGIVNSTNGNGHNSIHEMNVFSQNGQTFLLENFNSSTGSKILKVINVTNPASPVFVRDINPTEPQWVHAMHIRGNRLFTSGWGNSSARGRTEIYDISNISTQAPTLLGFIEDTTFTTSGNNMHSSWSSEDGNYLYSCRETTGSNGSNPADLRVYNITNPAQPMLVNKISMVNLGINAVSPHNPVVMGNKLYVSWYQAGTQIFDISNPTTPVKIGEYDTYAPEYAPSENVKGELSDEPWDMICGLSSQQNVLPTSYNGNWAVYPFLGEDKVLLGDLSTGLYIVDVTLNNQVSDFDGDARTDFSTYTAATGNWNIETSSNSSFSQINFGIAEDKIAAGDYDGDGKSDIAIFRPSTGTWWIRKSSSPGNFSAIQFGVSTDIPVAGDYDGDGKTDIAVFRPSTGVWYILQSTAGLRYVQWGVDGDKPFSGDYDGDGKSDVGINRGGVWYILRSQSGTALITQFGYATDKPVVGNFDGDAKADIAVYRPETGVWYVLKSSNNTTFAIQFGLAEDLPIPADYDGDGKADLAVYRPSSNVWYSLNSTNGAFNARAFGTSGDIPSPVSVQP
ncbi:MAG: FG-GAP-like repeat-containing protein [Pyrinomonadaceae bacterium]